MTADVTIHGWAAGVAIIALGLVVVVMLTLLTLALSEIVAGMIARRVERRLKEERSREQPPVRSSDGEDD